MLKSSGVQFSRCRGIVVWDFDGVLFDIRHAKVDLARIFEKNGAPAGIFDRARDDIMKRNKHFSFAAVERALRKFKAPVRYTAIRREFHRYLATEAYVDPAADRVLHRLRKKGFCHIILSFGSPPFQYKKIHVGCGRKFTKHFTAIRVTKKHKYLFLRQLLARYSPRPVFFIDDVEGHIILARKHLPGITAIHYKPPLTLHKVERLLLKQGAR